MRLVLLLVGLTGAVLAQEQPFTRHEGGQLHRFVTAPEGRVHLLLRPESRFILAFPSQNSGLALWFAGARLDLVEGPEFVSRKEGQAVRFRLRSSGTARIEDAVLGSIRTIRDREHEGAPGAERVRLEPEEVRSRLASYLDGLTPAERDFYRGRPVGEGGPRLGEFLAGGPVPPALAGGLEFMALSLDADGKPVEVMNSDASFELFLGTPSREDVERTLRLLELEFPVGLMTGVGPVVANPAYSRNPAHARQLDRSAYHGTVIWSWQSGMLMAGLLRQLERHRALESRLRRTVGRLEQAELRAGELANSELWTFDVDRGWRALSFRGSGETESNPVQLWSTLYPALKLRLLQAEPVPALP